MKYIKLFEIVSNKPKLKEGDYVKIIVDKLRIGDYAVSLERDLNTIFKIKKVYSGKKKEDEPEWARRVDYEIMYDIKSLNDNSRSYILTVFENEIEFVPEYEVDAMKYNL